MLSGRPDEKLASALRIFGECDGRWWEQYRQFDESRAFRHGAQWRTTDLTALQEAGRPAFTMNVIHNKIESVVGMNEDNKRDARAAPAGAEDQVLAEVLNKALAQVRKDAEIDPIDSQVYAEGITVGEHSMALDVVPANENPSWVHVVATPVRGEELAWDYGSKLPNRQDARYVFWSRWLDESEFKAEYPDRRRKLAELFDVDGFSMQYEGQQYYESDFDYKEELSRTPSFVNHRTREVRVLRMEYRVPYRAYYVVGPDGRHIEVPREQAERWKNVYPVVSAWKDRWKWFEFIRNEVLFDGDSPVPFQGFTVIPFTCYHDTKTNFVYGFVRHLKDPQQDVNKAYSATIEHLAAQGKPGYLAEHGAVSDQDAFEDSIQQGNATAWVNNGAITTGRIMKRDVPVYSEGEGRRLQNALDLCDRISGIVMDAENPNRAAEAATTNLLRERKSLRSMRSVLRNYYWYQKEVATRLCQVIKRAMPDDQVQAFIASPKIMVQGGMVVNQEEGQQAQLRDPSVRFDIDMAISERQDTQRLAQLDLLMQLAEKGVPIDPEVLLELAASTTATTERLKTFLKQAQQAQAQTMQQQTATQAQFQQGMLEVEQQKTLQEEAADQRKHLLERQKVEQDGLLKLLAIWEKADEAEKSRLMALAQAGAQPTNGGTQAR